MSRAPWTDADNEGAAARGLALSNAIGSGAHRSRAYRSREAGVSGGRNIEPRAWGSGHGSKVQRSPSKVSIPPQQMAGASSFPIANGVVEMHPPFSHSRVRHRPSWRQGRVKDRRNTSLENNTDREGPPVRRCSSIGSTSIAQRTFTRARRCSAVHDKVQ
ncbi:hypothetical protein BD413DRAFT_510768 [Trametes elegans]|nr:hypothetical protein BD413DRAFT_510768 [Trametes elegans]